MPDLGGDTADEEAAVDEPDPVGASETDEQRGVKRKADAIDTGTIFI